MPELPMIPAEGGIQTTNFPKPEIAPGAASGAIGEAAGNLGSQITDIATHLIEIRKDTQRNESAAFIDTATDKIAHGLLRDPKFRSDPAAATAEFQRQLTPLQAQAGQAYPYAEIDGWLTRNMTLWAARKGDLLSQHAFVNQIEDTEKEGDVYGMQALAGGSDQTKPLADQEALAQHYRDWVGRQTQRGLFTQGEADDKVAKFNYALAETRSKNWALANPRAALASDDPPKELTNGVALPATVINEMKNAAVAQLRRPMEEMNATNEAARADLMAGFTKAAKDGTLDASAVNQATEHALITGDDYKKLFGYAYLPAGNPLAIGDMQQQIKGAVSEDQLDGLHGTIQGQVNKEVYGRGAIGLDEQIETQRRQLKSVGGRARSDGRDQINAQFDSMSGMDAEMYDAVAKGAHLPTIATMRERALSSFEGHTAGEEDPGKISDAVSKALAEHSPDMSIVHDKAKMSAALRGTNPQRKLGESVADYGARMRKTMATPAATPVPIGIEP